MADAKRESVKFITPTGVAIYPKLHKPDTKFKKEGQYSVKLRLAPDAIPAETVEKLEALRDSQVEKSKAELTAAKKGGKVKTLKVRDLFSSELDAEGNETGNIIINAKMTASGISKKDGKPWTRSPLVFDAKRKAMKPVPFIYGGSELKVAVESVAYYSAKDNEVGVSFYLEAVQVIKLVKGSGERSAANIGFGEEEGYADEADVGGEQFDDSKATEPSAVPAGGDPEEF